jgi:polyketide cyclase/dehydrase/lipid transport protein
VWTAEHSIEAAATPEAVWRLWADVPRWPEWNRDIERIELSGPFATGSTISMTPAGQDAVLLRIAEAVEPELFVDEATVGDTVVRTVHRAEPLDADRVRITYRIELTGPAADDLGPLISGDFPETLAGLARHASR